MLGAEHLVRVCTLLADAAVPSEALERVLTDPTLARTLGDKGRQRVERHFCWSVCAQQMVAQYRARIDAC